jgi:hypothetical protein
MNKNDNQALSEKEKQLEPMKGEIDPKDLAAKLNQASHKAIIKSGIANSKSNSR